MKTPIILLNAGGTPSICSGLAANMPEPGDIGRLFIDTTNNLIYRDTGAAWVSLGAALDNVNPVLQTKVKEIGQSTFSNQRIPFDNSVPTIYDGIEYASITITKSPGTKLIGRFNAWFDTSSSNRIVTIATFRDNVCIDAAATGTDKAGRPTTAAISFSDSPPAGIYTYKIRIGTDYNTTIYVNQGRNGNLGKVAQSLFTIEEVVDTSLLDIIDPIGDIL